MKSHTRGSRQRRVAAAASILALLLFATLFGLVSPAITAANRAQVNLRVRNRRQVDDEDRPVVINGFPVTSRSNNEFSSLARISIHFFGTTLGSCTGSLVSVRYVLTAAHCVKKAKYFFFRLKYTDFTVVLGDLDTTQTESGEQTISGIGIPYPLYPSTFFAVDPTDIALIKLKQDATLSSTVQLASLPSSGYSPADGSEAIVAGWGLYEEGGQGDTSTLLRYGVIKVNGDSTSCSAKSASKQICFGPLNSATETNQSWCNGDSGGPIMRQVDGKYVVIATVSYVERNCPLSGQNLLSGGVSVAAYLDWINKFI